ncbi:hypothetical protein QBC45DRAFT_201649 [Copromyces sp. CBS 386.78]|nr:hypothetical protein QBC45DRAFT_201649 [Copromyces sp. CBS 386.78]
MGFSVVLFSCEALEVWLSHNIDPHDSCISRVARRHRSIENRKPLRPSHANRNWERVPENKGSRNDHPRTAVFTHVADTNTPGVAISRSHAYRHLSWELSRSRLKDDGQQCLIPTYVCWGLHREPLTELGEAEAQELLTAGVPLFAISVSAAPAVAQLAEPLRTKAVDFGGDNADLREGTGFNDVCRLVKQRRDSQTIWEPNLEAEVAKLESPTEVAEMRMAWMAPGALAACKQLQPACTNTQSPRVLLPLATS